MPFYGCTSYWKRDRAVCASGLVGRTEVIDAEVLATIGDDILRPSVVDRAVALALEELQPEANAERQVRLASELAALDAEHDELMASVRRGGDVAVLARLVGRLQAVQVRRQMLTTTRPASPSLPFSPVVDERGRRYRFTGRIAMQR